MEAAVNSVVMHLESKLNLTSIQKIEPARLQKWNYLPEHYGGGCEISLKWFI